MGNQSEEPVLITPKYCTVYCVHSIRLILARTGVYTYSMWTVYGKGGVVGW
jgi:hypothetical protein